MSKRVLGPVLVVGMILTIVVMDLVFFRGSEWFWERLVANVAVVAVVGGLYVRFVGRP